MAKCPRCDEPMVRPPALSRTDTKTKICEPCGTAEALSEHFDGSLVPQDEWPIEMED